MSASAYREKLLQELAVLRDAAATALGERHGRDSTAVFKVFSGLSLEVWARLAPEVDPGPLLALPLEGDIYPFVLHLVRTMEDLAAHADFDSTTGLPGSISFVWALENEVERAVRNQSSLSLALLDIDWIDQTTGISVPAGEGLEEFMAQAAAVITAGRRRYDFIARMSDNRFAIFFPGIGLQRTMSTLERLLNDVCTMNAQAEHVACNVGIASIKGRIPMMGKEFIALAENALAEAKAKGDKALVAAPIPDIAVTPKSTLVHSREKQFLFTGC
jgi:diguanylate cyclase (GGDEF)-like protein